MYLKDKCHRALKLRHGMKVTVKEFLELSRPPFSHTY